MISVVFDNWKLVPSSVSSVTQQYDNMTVDIVVSGNIPSGWSWTLLINAGSSAKYYDELEMYEDDGQLVCTLDDNHMTESGFYRIQLRGITGTNPELIKHTTVAQFYVSRTLDGDGKWPEVVTTFLPAVHRAESAAASASIDAERAELASSKYPYISQDTQNWVIWNESLAEWEDTGLLAKGMNYATFDVSQSDGCLYMYTRDDYYGPAFAINENGHLEVTVNANN